MDLTAKLFIITKLNSSISINIELLNKLYDPKIKQKIRNNQ